MNPWTLRSAGAALTALCASAASHAAPPPAFAPAVRVGYAAGDDWEPAIAADGAGHVYAMWKHYDVMAAPVTTCGDPSGCSARIVVSVSNDGGQTFGTPRAIHPGRVDFDSQIVVDPGDGKTVLAAFLIDAKSSVGVVKSTDFGQTWTAPVLAETAMKGADKPILAVRGKDVYVAWNAIQKAYVSASHDGGATWTSRVANQGGQLSLSLPGGGAVLPNGHVYFAWGGYERSGGPRGPVNLYATKSTDGGQTWQSIVIDKSESGVDCACDAYRYFAAQLVMAGDGANRVHVAYNKSVTSGAPSRVIYRSSNDGVSWTAPKDLSASTTGANHVFPALASFGSAGIRAAWMDDRTGKYQVRYRSSSDGGASWSDEVTLSANLGLPYQTAQGFPFPYGDYFEIDVTPSGKTVAIWAEAASYAGPGNVFFTRQP